MKRLLLTPIIAVPVIALLWTGFGRDPNAVPSPLVAQRAPSFTLSTLDGQRVSLASLAGHPIVLNFWASWCTDCITENPYLVAAWRRYAAAGVRFVGITFDDGNRQAAGFARRYGDRWLELTDPGSRTAIDYGVSGVPETFLIDKHGRIAWHVTGPILPGTNETPADFERQLRLLVEGAA